ncbi:MAG: membrane protein insertase YidC, partial [Deltaproteobacteria bacterium]|nr:membrane protein insertase YidC [Deltaproteobacteria bacterium]
MEKRTIIAFVLSFLVLITWSMIFSKKQTPAPEKAREELPKEMTQVRPETVPRPKKSPVPAQLPKAFEQTITPETHEKEIIVDTPLYRAIFSSAGATIKSFQLKTYRLTTDPESPFVELAQIKERG